MEGIETIWDVAHSYSWRKITSSSSLVSGESFSLFATWHFSKIINWEPVLVQGTCFSLGTDNTRTRAVPTPQLQGHCQCFCKCLSLVSFPDPPPKRKGWSGYETSLFRVGISALQSMGESIFAVFVCVKCSGAVLVWLA